MRSPRRGWPMVAYKVDADRSRGREGMRDKKEITEELDQAIKSVGSIEGVGGVALVGILEVLIDIRDIQAKRSVDTDAGALKGLGK